MEIEDTFDPVPPWAAKRSALEERIQWLKQEHVEAARALLARWPAGIPTLKQSDGHTLAQLDAIEAVLIRVQADHSIPF